MNSERKKIRVLIVDDIAQVRQEIYNILKKDQDIEVVGGASNGRDAIEAFDRLLPDVMTTCICMPVMNGIEASKIIISKHPNAIIIIISVQNEPDYMRRAILAGVKDFLPKPVDADELISSIHKYYGNLINKAESETEEKDTIFPEKVNVQPYQTNVIIPDVTKVNENIQLQNRPSDISGYWYLLFLIPIVAICCLCSIMNSQSAVITIPTNTQIIPKDTVSTIIIYPTIDIRPYFDSNGSDIEEEGCPNGCLYHKLGCDIKGNISYNTGEKIYHLPSDKYYYETEIDPAFGERWFCTESEATANGWRHSRV